MSKAGNGGIMRRRKTIILLLSVFSVFIVSAFIDGFDALADTPTVKAAGTLTSIENDGSVIIDNGGYGVDPSATIINRKGKSVPLRSLSLPAKVRFEYRYKKEGFIIVLIEEVKDKKVKK
ncbi:MAG: hypothetical protein A2Z09_06610 [Nitrospirae bacterium RBG_16_43_8]|nr:MAG: hypothetical protein A2Z09_06610 [Nitrospirae bacterium RBG_16_43_8]